MNLYLLSGPPDQRAQYSREHLPGVTVHVVDPATWSAHALSSLKDMKAGNHLAVSGVSPTATEFYRELAELTGHTVYIIDLA